MKERRDEIEKIIDKAKRSLEVSCREIREGNFDYACSRAYYVVFYLLEAVLLFDDRVFSKHSGVIASFNQEYVKTGIFPAWLSRHVKSLLKRRELADYSFSIAIGRDMAQESLIMAEEVFRELNAYLQKKLS